MKMEKEYRIEFNGNCDIKADSKKEVIEEFSKRFDDRFVVNYQTEE